MVRVVALGGMQDLVIEICEKLNERMCVWVNTRNWGWIRVL